MKLEVVTPFGAKVDETGVTEVVATGVLGELGVRPGHVPIITSLAPGRLVYEKDGVLHSFAADAGYLQAARDVVRVTTETILAPGEIDVERAEKARERAEAALREPANQTPEKLRNFQRALARARVRLEIAKLA